MCALRLPHPVALGAGALLVLGAAAAMGVPPGVGVPPGARAAVERTAASTAPTGHVVLLGVDGLQWSDVTAQTMPTLATLSGQGAPASLVTRAAGRTACPADGWLTLGTGARSTGGRAPSTPHGSDPLTTAPQPACADLPATPLTQGPYTIPEYSSYKAANAGVAPPPDFGALAEPVRRAGGCVAASGPGALLAAADARGRVEDYLGSADALSAADLSACALTLVDLGGHLSTDTSADTLYPPPVSRAAVFSAVDARIASLLPKLPIDSALIVAGLDDADPHAARLHVLLATGQSADGTPFTPGRRLRAATTRTDGLVQTLDLTPSLLHWIGLTDRQIAAAEPRPFTGAIITLGTPAPDGDGAAALSAAQLDTANVVVQDTDGAFVTWMVHAALILALAACTAFAAVATWLRGGSPWVARGRRLLLLALAAWATVLAAVVPAAFLVGLDDWSAAADPVQRLYSLIAALAVLLGLVVHGACRAGRLRERPLAPAGILALLTLAVIAGDLSSGSRLERQTPFGYSVIPAERFFGLGDDAIGLYCAAALIGTVFVARLILPDRPFAVLTVCLLGLLTTALCALPFWGDRPSGAIALAPAFALLALVTARGRLSWLSLLIPLAVCFVAGTPADGAGSQLPKTALLLAVPLGIGTCALGLLRAADATAAPVGETAAARDTPKAAATTATATSVRRPVPLGVQDQRGRADEA